LVSANDFLTKINTRFMAQTENPQFDMLRVSQEAAREILAQNVADVYKLTSVGAAKLRICSIIRGKEKNIVTNFNKNVKIN
jgi:fructose-1,6-bisphosphatase/inositol monophosphatase family enzyme